MCSRIVLFRYAGQANNLVKYIKLAALLPEKTVRDVALRCIWITVSVFPCGHDKFFSYHVRLFWGHDLKCIFVKHLLA
jgi:hypothetical protein